MGWHQGLLTQSLKLQGTKTCPAEAWPGLCIPTDSSTTRTQRTAYWEKPFNSLRPPKVATQTLPKGGGTRSPSQKKWHPLLQNPKHPGPDPLQRCQTTVFGHYLCGALARLHTKTQRSSLPCPKEVCWQNFKKAALRKWKTHAKWILSGRRLPSKDGYRLHDCTN